MTSTKPNAVDLLVQDHRDVKELFEKFEGLPDRSSTGKKKIADEICRALTVHAEVEEEIFYPAVRKEISDDDLMDEALVEHAAARDLIAQIQAMDPEDDLYDAKVRVLSEQIEHHVAEEERDMFPKVEKTKLDLNVLGEEMRSYKEVLEHVEA